MATSLNILKALVVTTTRKHAPHTHDLIRLQEMARLHLTEEQLDLLDTVNDFNIRTRYPEFKLDFYKKCTRSYTQAHITHIVSIYNILCKKLKQKK